MGQAAVGVATQAMCGHASGRHARTGIGGLSIFQILCTRLGSSFLVVNGNPGLETASWPARADGGRWVWYCRPQVAWSHRRGHHWPQ